MSPHFRFRALVFAAFIAYRMYERRLRPFFEENYHP